MIKVTDLIADGIWLAAGDVVVALKDNSFTDADEKVSVYNENWLGEGIKDYLASNRSKGEDMDLWYVVELAERKNETGEQPVPDWVAVEYNYSVLGTQGMHKDLAGELSWDLDKWEEGEWWKPDLKALTERYSKMEHYSNKDSEEKNKEETEESWVIVSEDENTTKNSLTEAAVYTKELFDRGILPEEGMLVNFGGDDTYIEEIRYDLEKHGGLFFITAGGGIGYMSELVFPAPEKSLEDIAKELYYSHMDMDLPEEGYEYMWDQCSDKYKQAWITIASNGEE